MTLRAPRPIVLSERQPLAGVRVFHRGNGTALMGVVGPAWSGPEATASCFIRDRGPHRSPDPTCSCGIGMSDGIATLDACEYLVERERPLLAAVVAWGRICLDYDGLATGSVRAEHARVVALAVPDQTPRRGVAAIASRWAVPVVSEDEIEIVAARSGISWADLAARISTLALGL